MLHPTTPVSGQEEARPATAKNRASIFDKCRRFHLADDLKTMGIYPYFRVIESGQDTEVVTNGRPTLMLGSNSYLELTTHPLVKQRSMEAIAKYGTGCAGSRFLNGTLPIHLELEERLARFVGKEAALVFPTGFQTNTGVLSCIAGRGEYILSDKMNHACIVDGCYLSFAKTVRFGHSDMADLERELAALPIDAGKLIVTDGVFSMEGDICKLPQIVELAAKYNASVMVDDAHGLGVLGAGGRGTADHFGLTDKVDLIMGTFSKSLAAIGGFIAGSERAINFLKHRSRPFMFSASAAPASVAAVLAALDVLKQEPERIQRLWDNATFLKKGLDELGFDTGPTETPVIPVMVGELEHLFKFWRWLSEHGVFINPVVPPAVPPGRCLVRISVTAGHTRQQMQLALDRFAEGGRIFGLIK